MLVTHRIVADPDPQVTPQVVLGLLKRHIGSYWGLGWGLHGPKQTLGDGEVLSSAESFSHAGFGHVMLWVDPVYELVMACFSVLAWKGLPAEIRVAHDSNLADWKAHRSDLFVNAATAAVG